MTLVELLVVLAILAGLTVAVMASSAATRERARAERTARDGEAIAEALARSDGLSLVSDLGHLPAAGEVPLLFTHLFTREVLVEDPDDPTNPDPVAVTKVCRAPGWAMLRAPLIPAATTPAYSAAEMARFSAATNHLPEVTLGAGWRGPYLTGNALRTETTADPDLPLPTLRDGFGGLWEVTEEDGVAVALVSRGRDRLDDSLRPADEPVAWQDRDRTQSLRVPATTLTVTARLPGSEANPITRLHAFLFQPGLTVPTAGTDATATLICRYARGADNADALTFTEGVTHGARALFVCAETSAGVFVAPPRPLTLRPGHNALTLTLWPPTAFPAP